MTITRSTSLGAALEDVRKGTDDAAVRQHGSALVVRYSIADPTTAAVVNAVFSVDVKQADLAATGRPPGLPADRASRSRTPR